MAILRSTDDSKKLSESEILDGLIDLKLGKGLRRIFGKLYLLLTAYELEYKVGQGSTSLFFVEDLVPRLDFQQLLKQISERLHGEITLYVYKRKFSVPRYLTVKGNLAGNIQKIWRTHFQHCEHIILFCVHTMSGFILQNLAKVNGQKTYTFQHGYYSYSSIENRVFSAANSVDKAYAFSPGFSDFFSNCKEVEFVGSYHGRELVEPEIAEGTFLHLPFLNNANCAHVREWIHRFLDENGKVSISYHPRQGRSEIDINAFLSPFGHDSIISVFPGRLLVGEVNYFIETTAWTNFKLTTQFKAFFVEKTAITEILPGDSSNIDKLADAIRRDLHGSQP